jgi:hypothetical protein
MLQFDRKAKAIGQLITSRSPHACRSEGCPQSWRSAGRGALANRTSDETGNWAFASSDEACANGERARHSQSSSITIVMAVHRWGIIRGLRLSSIQLPIRANGAQIPSATAVIIRPNGDDRSCFDTSLVNQRKASALANEPLNLICDLPTREKSVLVNS